MIELASKCQRSTAIINLSKFDAAQEQLEGAIHNLFLGNWACAVTLACAAEGMLPTLADDSDLFSIGRKLGITEHGMTGEEVSNMFNDLSHWLKHPTPQKPSSYDIRQWHAVEAILRAYSRLCAHQKPFDLDEVFSENTAAFEAWYREHYAHLIDQVPSDSVRVQQ
jgi:hypothetical protein